VEAAKTLGSARRILVAYDGTPSARRALARAAAMYRPGDDVALISVTENGEADEAHLDRARTLLAGRGIAATSIAATGNPARTICVMAERDAFDVIVVGRRNPTDTGQVLLGSVSARVVSGAPCDVVVVA